MLPLLSLLACLLVAASPLPARADDTVTITVTPSTPASAAIPPNLVAFSIEVYDFVRWTDWYPNPTRPAWLNLMRQLILTPGQKGPRYRIGGDSTDLTVYDMSPLPKLPTGEPIIHSLNATELLSWKQALAAINSEAILGLNFRQPTNASWAVAYAKAIDQYIGWDMAVALEIGNEVDLFASNRIRNASYGYAQYKEEFLLYTRAVSAAVPAMPKRIYQGMVTIFETWLGDELTDYLQAAGPTLYSISQHGYPVPSCNGEEVTIQEILDDQYATSIPNFLSAHKTVQTLNAQGIEFVIGEGSEAVCNGQGPMVLNTFSTALWGIHQLFEIARVGTQNFFFHSWGTGTDTFSVLVWGNPTARDRFLVMPLYYALRVFAMATMYNATLVQADIASSNPHIHAWATVSTAHTFSLVVVHKDVNATGNATVSIILPLTGTAPTAVLMRLLAPSVTSVYNVTLAGQTYDGSVDGEPIGKRVDEAVQGTAVQGGVRYTVTISPISALLMRLQLPTSKDSSRIQRGIRVQ